MGFKVSFDDIWSVNQQINNQISNWNEQLSEIEKDLNGIINMDSFQGKTADSVKLYLKEVHGVMLTAIQTALMDYMMKFELYRTGYYDIDGDIHAKLNKKTLKETIKKYKDSGSAVEEIQANLKNAIEQTSDIYYPGLPSTVALESYHDMIISRMKSTIEDVNTYEDTIFNGDLKDLENLIQKIRNYMKSCATKGKVDIVNYVEGDYLKSDHIYDLGMAIKKSDDYAEIHKKDLDKAFKNDERIVKQLSDERLDHGVAQMLKAGITIGVGVAAIAVSGGAATPVVVAGVAAVTGGCTVLYGASELAEGGQNAYYGWKKNINTAAWNPIRDTVFMGNQELYSRWGSLNETVAALCIPVGKSASLMKGVPVKEVVIRGVAKGGIKKISGVVSGQISSAVIDTFGIESETGTLLVEETTKTIVNTGVDKLETKADTVITQHEMNRKGGFSGMMSKEDAARYEKYLESKEYLVDGPYIKDGKPNGRPTLFGTAKLEFEQKVYEAAIRNSKDGLLHDPNTGEIIDWKPGDPRDDIVDFGHKKGLEYDTMFEKYRKREITLEELKDFQFNPDNYQLETVHGNRSHAYEKRK